MSRRRRSYGRRSGFVLVAALWLVTGATVLATVAMLASREALSASRNRTLLTAARWRAQGCAERARAAVGEALQTGSLSAVGVSNWSVLDTIVTASSHLAGCDVRLVPAGRALDVSVADGAALERLFFAAGRSDAAWIAAAVLDWRDTDDEPRPTGAEREWYTSQRRMPPRNGPPLHPEELRRIRGLEDLAGLDTLLATEAGRVCLNHASAPVLASLPGFTPEAIAHVLALRERGERIISLIHVAGAVPPSARDSITAHFSELSLLTTTEPDAWLLVSSAVEGKPDLVSTVELKLANAGRRAAVVRRRVRG